MIFLRGGVERETCMFMFRAYTAGVKADIIYSNVCLAQN